MSERNVEHVYSDLVVGQIVRSKAGRDKDTVYLVWEVFENGMVAVVDGKHRKINHPKMKKRKHLQVYCHRVDDFDQLRMQHDFHDARVRKLLAPYLNNKPEGDPNG